MKKLALLLVLSWLLSACLSSKATLDPNAVQTAIAQTAAANPTETSPPPTETPEPTKTPTLTETATSIPTSTATETPSPTPDLRVIDADPYTFLLTKEDLPEDANYYLPNSSWISPHRNSEVVGGWGVEEGRLYLEETGRVDGWWVSYNRGSNTVIAPQEIYDNVVMYRTADGAQLTINEHSSCDDPDTSYLELETDLVIGDITRVCIDRKMQSSGENREWYRIEFVYRNYFHGIEAWGWEKDIRPEYVEAVARTLLAKLEAAPLSDSVTFEP
jgi:hypothetical protein